MKTCKRGHYRSEATITILNLTKVYICLVLISAVTTNIQLSSASHLPANYSASSNQRSSTEEGNSPSSIPTASLSEDIDSSEDNSEFQRLSSSSSTTDSSNKVNISDKNAPTTSASKIAHGKRLSISAFCDDQQITIFGQFLEPFKGRMYAYGYPDESECGVTAVNDPAENITFFLPLGQCGVQMTAVDDDLDNDLRHEVSLYIQYSSYLQQIIDEKVTVNCVETKKAYVDEISQSLEDSDHQSSRQGRRLGINKEVGKGLPKISSKIGEAWMEILAGKDPSPKSKRMSPITVGEDVTLVISTKVIRGYDARIVNCTAHDGSRHTNDGYRAQQILDSSGCSVDKALVPNFRRRRLPIESRNRLITLHFSSFPAFKFPERDHLHVKCSVAYCQGLCPSEPCDSGINHFGTWRDKYGRIADVLIDSAEIVNSVEVTAPDLEDIGGHHYERHQSAAGNGGSYSSAAGGESVSGRQFSDTSFPSNSNAASATHNGPSMYSNSQVPLLQQSSSSAMGNNVCVSPGTVILALVILGVVLVISATATLWFALKRSEAKKYHQAKHAPFQQHGPQPYYRFSHW